MAADGGNLATDTLVGDDGFEATRRLSDKILAAFNHAYAAGEHKIADMLRGVLVANEGGNGVPADRRGGSDPLGQAENWVAFVEARNHYNQLCETRPGDDADAALAAMKDAYQRWTRG